MQTFSPPNPRGRHKDKFFAGLQTGKASRPFSEAKFLKERMVETAGVLCPESEGKFGKKKQLNIQDSC